MFLLVLLALSVTATPTSTQFAAGERAVVIRIDDIQDYARQPGFADPEYTVLQYHIDNRIPALLSIVAGNFGTDQRLVNLTREGLKAGVFEIGIHGWHHVPITNQSETQQLADINRAETLFSSIFGIRVLALVPPDGNINQGTIEAMQATGLTLLSASGRGSGHPGEVAKGIAYFPETVRTAEVNETSKSWIPVPMQSIATQFSGSWVSYGIAVAVIHPRQFVDESGKWSENKWNAYIQMVDWIKANGGTILLPQPVEPKTQGNLSPFLIPAALFSGLTSVALLTLTIRARRNANRKLLPNLNPSTQDVRPEESSYFDDTRTQDGTPTVLVNNQGVLGPNDHSFGQG